MSAAICARHAGEGRRPRQAGSADRFALTRAFVEESASYLPIVDAGLRRHDAVVTICSREASQ